MDKIIAIPIENGVLCSHFGHCEKFAIIKLVDNKIESIEEIAPPEHIPGLYPGWVAKFNTTDVIIGGIGENALQLFREQNINVFVGATIKEPKELVMDFVNNNLKLQKNHCNH